MTPGARAQAVEVVARIFCCPTGEARVDLVQQAIQAAVEEDRKRIERDVLKVIGGIAVSHRWFPLTAALQAIRQEGDTSK